MAPAAAASDTGTKDRMVRNILRFVGDRIKHLLLLCETAAVCAAMTAVTHPGLRASPGGRAGRRDAAFSPEGQSHVVKPHGIWGGDDVGIGQIGRASCR